MARSARLYFPGGIFHIISRCLNRDYLLEGDAERERYRGMLELANRRSDARVLAWCIMSNHVHLVLRAGDEALSGFMRRVNTGYAQWKNRCDGRLGPVFAERYKAILVEKDEYLLELVRYVHLNPVRAGVVAHPDGETWSSHRCYAGLERSPAWLDASVAMEMLGKTRQQQREAYRTFIEDGLDEPRRSPHLSGDGWVEAARTVRESLGAKVSVSDAIVGSEDWTAEVLRHVKGDRVEESHYVTPADKRRSARPLLDNLVDLTCDVVGVERIAFDLHPKRRSSALARKLVSRVWVEDYGRTQLELARLLKTSPSQVSRWRAQALERYDEHHDLLSDLRARLPEVEGALELTSGGRVEPRRGSQRTTYNVELLREENVVVHERDKEGG